MAKLSTEITGKIRSGLFLLSALFEQGPKVAELLLAKARTSLPEGATPADFLGQIQGLAQILKASLDDMVEGDRRLFRENGARGKLLRERDDLVDILAQSVTGLRRIVTGYFVEPDVQQLGLNGRTAREPIALLRQAEEICEGLKREDLSELLGKELFEPPPDLKPIVPQIEPEIDTLRLAFEAHQKSRRRVDELLVTKKKAVESYETAFVRVARQFEDLCRLVDQKDLADKVRPSLTRRGETATKTEDDDSAESSEVAAKPEVPGDVPRDISGADGSSPSVDETAAVPRPDSDTDPVSEGAVG